MPLPDKIYCSSVLHSTGKEQCVRALRCGRPERDIFVEGRGAENFMACVNAIRGPGTLGLVGGVYVLGQTRRAIMEKIRVLRERKITPYDLISGTFDPAELLSEAIGKINSSRATGKGPKPKVRGKRGGEMKGLRAQEYRDAVMQEDVVKRLWYSRLSGREVLAILGKPWSESTLHRKYGAKQRQS